METLQAFAVLAASLSALTISVVIWRRAASLEDRLTRIDKIADRLEGGTQTNIESDR